jgi:accessory gene regulator protein AgrB
MIIKIAEHYARLLVEKSSETEREYQIYRYSLIFYISTIFQLTLIFSMTYLLGLFLYALPIVLMYIPLRAIAGGYHHKYLGNCTLFSMIEIILFSYLAKSQYLNNAISIAFICIFMIVTIITSMPKDNIYLKPTNRNKKIVKKLYIIVLILMTVLVIVFPNLQSFLLAAITYSCLQCSNPYYVINIWVDKKIKIEL